MLIENRVKSSEHCRNFIRYKNKLQIDRKECFYSWVNVSIYFRLRWTDNNSPIRSTFTIGASPPAYNFVQAGYKFILVLRLPTFCSLLTIVKKTPRFIFGAFYHDLSLSTIRRELYTSLFRVEVQLIFLQECKMILFAVLLLSLITNTIKIALVIGTIWNT